MHRSQTTFWTVLDDLSQELGPDVIKRIKARDTPFVRYFPKDKIPEKLKSLEIIQGDKAKKYIQEQGLVYRQGDNPCLIKMENAKVAQTNQLGLAYLQYAQSKNVQVRNNVRMKGWISDKSGKILGIETDKGPIYADTIILATGMHSKLMVKPLGLSLPLVAGKGYSINYEEKKETKLPSLDVNYFDYHSSLYYNKTPGQIRQSGIFEVTTFTDTKINQAKIKRMTKFMELTFGVNVQNFSQKIWTHHRPCLPQDLPTFGRVPGHPNVYLATGTGTRGTILSNAVSEFLVAEITGKKEEMSPIYSQIKDQIDPAKYLTYY